MNSFEQLFLPKELNMALEKLKFVETTKIQDKAIPHLLMGKDVMACAETGSGKTAAYSIPMVAKLMGSEKNSGLILAPTRELAIQISQFLQELTIKCSNFQITLLVGGQDIRKQFKQLQKKPRIIVATPGRLTDHLMRNTVQIHNTEFLVLDEGDRMIDMGFAPQLERILKYLPEKRQTSFFTATLDDKVTKLAKKYLINPQKIIVGKASKPVETVNQSVIEVEFKEKDDRILDELNSRQGSIIVFLRTKYRTDRLAKHLKEYGYEVSLIHGGRNQSQRNRAIRDFKAGKTRILCATDVAARGLDIPSVEHVINFDLPDQDEDYIHRIGRTARNGAEGDAVTFVTPEQHQTWNILANKFKIVGVELKGQSRKGAKKDNTRGKKKSSKSSGKRKTSKTSGKRKFSKSSKPSEKKFGKKKTSKKSAGKKKTSAGSSTTKRAKSVKKDSSKKVSFKKKKSGKKTNQTSGKRNRKASRPRSRY